MILPVQDRSFFMSVLFKTSRFFIAIVIISISGIVAAASPTYKLNYLVELDPVKQGARVTITIENKKHYLEKIEFRHKDGLYSDVRANGRLVETAEKVVWDLPDETAKLTYFVKLTRQKGEGKYDSLVTKDWAIFRGDTLIPAVTTTEKKKAEAVAIMEVVLPEGWTSVETGWARLPNNRFKIDNPERLFDRPIGWIIAGKLGTRRASVKGTSIAVSAPKEQNMRRMDVITFLNFAWAEMHTAFKKTPEKLLIVGANDPMWRGGLSASNSLFLHADRPMVSENGTSPLLHELTHMVTRISGVVTEDANDDWIAEGIAEFYSVELLYRAGGMTKSRKENIMQSLLGWGNDVVHLRKAPSTGEITARAVVFLNDLDREIRRLTKDKKSLDDVVRELMVKRKVSLDDLKLATRNVTGKNLITFNTSLLQ